MSGVATRKKERERMVFILCGAAGLRIGEALGIEIEKRLKTTSASRQVDLHPAIASILMKFAGERKTGVLFCTRNGKPLGSSCILRRRLHLALKQLGFINPLTGTHKAGHHAFRRFRNTHLRNRTECPEGLRRYWMGHADESMPISKRRWWRVRTV